MKSIEELYSGMLADLCERTGTQISGTSEMAVRLYAVAAQIHALYVQGEWVARQCFPQTAQGEYLDRHAALRGLSRRGAARAQGTLCFLVDGASGSDLAVPLGTVCMTAGQMRFVTTQAGVLRAGTTSVTVPAEAAEPGEAGNVPAETVLTMAVAPVGIRRCSNPAPFLGGMDEEEDEALRQRVLETFRRMPNGANAAFYEQGAMSFEQVAAAQVIPRPRGKGSVDVVVSTLDGVPDQNLLAQLEEYFQARREIAVDVKVKAPVPRTVDLTIKVRPAEGYTQAEAQQAVRRAVEGWFDGRRLGKSVLRAEVSSLVFGQEEVGNCAVTAPAGDMALAVGELPRLGQLTVAALEGTA
ncbi:baseplate J/gp47 family protein [Pseudoflavonifractor sp. 524-17]|uniref:baseplate J/gp47 family protein n=1 Tax=Pseudoflavonifractor sp. 524-17 TaxID=2304577 RepID=UPI001379B862|nr:baseplate J/gp47 family protein [Pseudoflavonifractor sp. 524-17]NCE64671.1 baseplate J/gp47 family protein [Pseudoflavonifractor sp. 524-17]